MDKLALKQLCCNTIDAHREKIIALAEDIYRHPEMGYHEFRSTEKVASLLSELGLDVTDGIAYTGCEAKAGNENGPVVAVMGELDSLNCPDHPDCADNGNMHSCGHHAQLAYLYGCAIGLVKTGILNRLSGSVKFVAIPAEECVELDYRNSLIKEGKIAYYGGKQEYLRRGGMNDVDMILQAHLINTGEGKLTCLNTDCNGFVTKTVRFLGRAAHAGFAPHEGVNALNMANLAISAIHNLRETFRDEDKIRVSAIITKGGDMVNVVPAEVEMQIMVRAFTVEPMLETSQKIDRALKAGALALGGQVEIQNRIGYLPMQSSRPLTDVYRQNFVDFTGCDDSAFIEPYQTSGSTDLGDMSQLVPCLLIWTGGISGALHASDFKVEDPEAAYILPAKMLAMTIIDLLYGNAETAREVMDAFRPGFTSPTEYLDFLEAHSRVELFDGATI